MSDKDVREAVRHELAWDPDIDDGHLIVSVKDAIVELTGEVPVLDQVRRATRAALRVKGVSAVVNDVSVRVPFRPTHTDSEIAKAVRDAVFWNSRVPRECVSIAVTDRVVTLSGEVEWNFQRQEAQRIAEHTVGVTRVDNQVTLPRRPIAADAAERIRAALERAALRDAAGIEVDIAGNEIILRGAVASHAEKADAGQAAWSTPNVTNVMNLLDVTSSAVGFRSSPSARE